MTRNPALVVECGKQFGVVLSRCYTPLCGVTPRHYTDVGLVGFHYHAIEPYRRRENDTRRAASLPEPVQGKTCQGVSECIHATSFLGYMNNILMTISKTNKHFPAHTRGMLIMLIQKLRNRSFGLCALLIAFAGQAISLSELWSRAPKPKGIQHFTRGGLRGFANRFLEIAARAPSVQNKTTLTPQFFLDQGSQRVQVSYGPFVVPNTNINNGMEDYELRPVDIGCKNCTITYMEAGLQYPNGTYANANTSLWLHHVVLYNHNNLDTVCGVEEPGERFFASGNERDPANISING
jgi:hypothetical protein